MKLLHVLRQLENEVDQLDAHFAEGMRNRRFIEEKADMIVSFGLLLRDLAADSAHAPAERKRVSEEHFLEHLADI